ncbi:TRAP transporter small permease subunit [Mangrovicoccus algicola]|uniref:TRAP transporter small permease protein n=1 Tax=Mangrovicoccus algicola TaxID=2771008 RepID=A0A8J7CUJ3_9RHOB|nr:TRAP transporter small permease subunit [Mangrovicoccus algicola]MBE3637574.1 TRAP transporter small permease subunit [Mangrovicoccus algicola]
MDRLATWISRLFGAALLFLSGFVALETVLRKAFNTSLQGADELGGYILAFGAAAAFTVALIDRAHVRIDVLHRRFALSVQAWIDLASVLSLGLLGLFFLYVGWGVIADTIAYKSTAATPWRTPLIWPQAAWYGALALFAVAALWLSLRALMLVARGRIRQVAAEFNPKSAEEELSEELDQLHAR